MRSLALPTDPDLFQRPSRMNTSYAECCRCTRYHSTCDGMLSVPRAGLKYRSVAPVVARTPHSATGMPGSEKTERKKRAPRRQASLSTYIATFFFVPFSGPRLLDVSRLILAQLCFDYSGGLQLDPRRTVFSEGPDIDHGRVVIAGSSAAVRRSTRQLSRLDSLRLIMLGNDRIACATIQRPLTVS